MSESDRLRYEVIAANIALHTRLADDYATCEPHFRAENVVRVSRRIRAVVRRTNARRLLDLGCGTGFIIDLARQLVEEIDGVDVTPAMLAKVDLSGPAKITLHECDTGTFQPTPSTYDVVTAYSFLHHLHEIRPTIETAFRALRPGGAFYADLDPNADFWDGIAALDRTKDYDPIVEREVQQTVLKDQDMERRFGVPRDIFNKAEYGKNIRGGFRASELEAELRDVGFSVVRVFYSWFLGEGALINDTSLDRDARFSHADVMTSYLRRGLPLTRGMFKYLGVEATK